jgi:YD repeat-containing protein
MFAFSPPFWGQSKSEWYISNAGGMAIEKAASRFAALRSPYCLLVEEGSSLEAPGLLVPYYRTPWLVELRILYKDGKESRCQWLFRDGGLTRLAAVFTRGGEDLAEEESAVEKEGLEEDGAGEGEKKPPLGFIEIFGEHGLIVMERQFLDDGELIIDYVYRNAGNRDVLIRADTRKIPLGGAAADLYTDYYRYTRNYSLRLIERIFPRPADDDSGGGEPASAALVKFPRRSLDSEKETGFVAPVPVYGSRFLEDIQEGSLQRILYTTDERGRILTETREDEEGNIAGELRNTWSGERLSRIIWKTGEEERVTEYDYNGDGDRIEERNYRNGVLERLVRVQGDREDEELYMNGELILRTRWEGGKKVYEEQVRSGGRPARRRGNP